MEEKKTVQISVDQLIKLDSAITAIHQLSGSLYNDVFSALPEGILEDKSSLGQNKFEKAFFWFNDNYRQTQSVILAIETISELAQEHIPDY